MGKLIYSGITSLDGYIVDAVGAFDWSAPDEEVHAFVNDLERPVGTYLFGRRMYEVMSVWETLDTRRRAGGHAATSPGSGGPPTRSSTRRRWTPTSDVTYAPRARPSTPTQSGG